MPSGHLSGSLKMAPFVLDYDLTFVDNDSHLKSGLSYQVVFWEPTVAQKEGLRGQQHSSAFVVPVKGTDRHKTNIHLPGFHTAFGCTVSPGKEPMLFWQKQPLSSLFKVSDVGKLEFKARMLGKPKWNRSLQCSGTSEKTVVLIAGSKRCQVPVTIQLRKIMICFSEMTVSTQIFSVLKYLCLLPSLPC